MKNYLICSEIEYLGGHWMQQTKGNEKVIKLPGITSY